MPFAIRSIDECVSAFDALKPDDELRNQGARDGAEDSWAFRDLEQWPESPPVASVYRIKDPSSYSKKVWEDPRSLMGFAGFQAIGTWNANGSGKWAHGDGWAVLDVHLVQEQAEDDDMLFDSPGGSVSLIFAIWRVEEGFACAVWNSHLHEAFTKVLGFNPWNEASWEHCTVWHGE